MWIICGTKHSIQPYVFLKIWKVPEITSAVELHFTEVSANRSFAEKEPLFGKFPRRPAGVLKSSPPRKFQGEVSRNFRKAYEMTLPKFKFCRTPMDAF